MKTMAGKVKRKLIEQVPFVAFNDLPLVCPICERDIPTAQRDAHHLVPNQKVAKTHNFYIVFVIGKFMRCLLKKN
jgi:hypothetical protein